MNDKEKSLKKLSQYFDVSEKKNDYELWCKKCSKGWALAKTSDGIGNNLFLLNHAYSHKPEAIES